jgi:hypothetical protein
VTGVNADELKMIAEEHTSPYHTSDDVMRLYRTAMEKSWSFFLINYKKPPKERYWRNLDENLQ